MRKPFSISPTKKVYFSRGNLIYRAYDNTWSVTDQQFSFVGDDTAGNVYGNNGSLNQKSSNTKISSTYQGWIDLFGWGTGSNPTLSSVNDADYKTFVDWSVNTINKEGTYDWRTPSAYELEYILSKRDKAGQLRGLATVFGVKGYVLLPDDWVANSEVSFTPDPSSFDINNYTVARWQKLEAKGAVFLPIAGFRDGKTVSLINMVPRYWTSTKNDGEDLARTLYFGYSEVSALGGENCHKGLPVRLICDM